MAQLLELDAVHARIGEYQILQGVSIAVPEHGVTVLLGRNGAGKTTTLRTVMGYVKAHSGTVRLRDKAISGLRPYQIARLGVSYLPEEGHVFGNLTIQENLWLSAKRDGQQAARIEQAMTVFPALQPAWKRHAATLSGGQKQMLAMASLLVAAQPVLLIDEPSKGLSPTVVDQLVDVLKLLKETATILLVEQNFQLARRVADWFTIIDDGCTRVSGSMAELEANEAWQRQYLGLSSTGGAV